MSKINMDKGSIVRMVGEVNNIIGTHIEMNKEFFEASFGDKDKDLPYLFLSCQFYAFNIAILQSSLHESQKRMFGIEQIKNLTKSVEFFEKVLKQFDEDKQECH